MAPSEAPQASNLARVAEVEHRAVSSEPEEHFLLRAGSIRLRGCALRVLARLYPVAFFKLHLVGAPAHSDLRLKSTTLHFHANGISSDGYYRVDLEGINVSEAGQMGWGLHRDVAPLFSAEDYINAMKLGGAAFKKWMMFVWFTEEDHIWVVAPQVEGKAYTMEECIDALDDMPDHIRREVKGFGPRTWTVGQPIPRCYLAKDLPTRLIENKIWEVMRR